MEVTRRQFMKGSAAAFALAAAGMGTSTLVGCAPEETEETPEEEVDAVEAEAQEAGEEAEAAAEEAPAEEEVDNTVSFDEVDIEAATADEVQAAIGGDGTLLVDARPWEAYAGWALEGAANGGHLKGAKLYSKRWIDCEYAGAAPRADYLARSLAEEGIADASAVIVYDYTGEQATTVAQYLASQGVANVKTFQANELIDADDLESYENHRMFLPTEIVKSISDVKTGKETELSDAAKEIVGDRIDDVVLIDVCWGNASQSGYLTNGHVPGAIHINTDCYERPRVYVPEKRSEYAQEWRKIPLEEFRDLCVEYGITKDSIAIVSCSYTGPTSRLGFYLRALGIETYTMVGAFTAWNYNGYEMATGPESLVIPEAAESFGSDEINSEEYNTEMVKEALAGERDAQICDNRLQPEWDCEATGYGYHDIAGRIDGTISTPSGNVDYMEYYENADRTPRTREEIVAELEGRGLDISKDMVFFCGDSMIGSSIAYNGNAVDIPTTKVWTQGWIPWSNDGNEFIDHNGDVLHYDKWLDTVVDAEGNDKRDGVNFLDDEQPEA